MSKPNPLSLLLTEQERNDWKEFGAKHGCYTYSKLIRAAVIAAMKNPAILDITGTSNGNKLFEEFNTLTESWEDHLESWMQGVEDRFDSVDKQLERLVKMQGATPKQIKKLKVKSDDTGAVFDD